MSEENKSIRFFGPDEVLTVVETEETTEVGSPVVKISFANGKEKLVPKKVYELLVSDSASDLTSFRNAKMAKIVPVMMQLIGEYDLAYEDMENLCASLKTSITINFNKAIYFALHGTVEGFDTAAYPTDTMMYSDMYRWLKKSQETNETKPKTTETGSEVAAQ